MLICIVFITMIMCYGVYLMSELLHEGRRCMDKLHLNNLFDCSQMCREIYYLLADYYFKNKEPM